MSPRVVLPVPVGTPQATQAFLPQLRAAMAGSGPPVLPYAAGSAPPTRLRPGKPLSDDEDDARDPTAVLVATSGSTGTAKAVLLPASALLASASATHDRLGGPGRWLLALPAHHVAGLQVLVRSAIAGTVPVVQDIRAGFDPDDFARAAGEVDARRRYTALVPTQLGRIMDAGGAALAALVRFDAVLVGGAAAGDLLLEGASAAGVRVVTTYGMTETCGGCVYEGRPLDGVRVALEVDGRIRVAGPVLARGYRDAGVHEADAGPPSPFETDVDGVRWYRTDDAGAWVGPGGQEVLAVHGRLDDVIVTGGLKVAPAPVEAALLALPEVAEAVVVATADAEWGQRVVAALVLRPGASAPSLARVRAHVAAAVTPHAAPRALLVLDHLPSHGPGKPDRSAIAELAAERLADASPRPRAGPVPGSNQQPSTSRPPSV